MLGQSTLEDRGCKYGLPRKYIFIYILKETHCAYKLEKNSWNERLLKEKFNIQSNSLKKYNQCVTIICDKKKSEIQYLEEIFFYITL